MGRKSTVSQFLGKKIGGIIILTSLEVINGRLWVECKCCECDKIFKATFHNVYRGNYKSCGCLQHALNNKNPKWSGHGEISKSYFYCLKRGASIRNIEFNISIEYIWNLFLKQDRKCIYTGEYLFLPKTRLDTKSTASLDRINSDIGYLENNVQWVHKDINFMKQSLTDSKFLEYIQKIYIYKFKNK